MLGFAGLDAVAQIILRNFFGTSLIWIEPLLQNAVLWIGLLGAMIASRNDEHIRIDVASTLLPEKYHPYLTVAVDLFTAFICVLVAWYSVGFVIEEYEYATPAPAVSAAYRSGPAQTTPHNAPPSRKSPQE